MHNDNLRFALNASKANKVRECWKKDLSTALGHPVIDEAFLAIERTAELKKLFFSIVRCKWGSFYS